MKYISKLVKIFTRCNAIKGINRFNKLREESWTTSFLACHVNVLIDVLCSQCACIWSLLHVLNCFNGCTFLQRTINSDEKDFLQNLSWFSFVYEKKDHPWSTEPHLWNFSYSEIWPFRLKLQCWSLGKILEKLSANLP